MESGKSTDGDEVRTLVPVESSTTFGEMVVVDDSPLWVAWEAAIQAWLDAKQRKSGSENTSRTYQTALRQFEEWVRERLGRPDLLIWPIVSSAMAQEWAAYLADALADSTVNLKLSALSSFYDFVRQRYIIPTPDGQGKSLWPANQANPFDAVERAKITQFGRAVFPDVEEMEAILRQINTRCLTGKRDFALIYTYLVTCRRFSELINLRWGDIRKLSDGKYAFRYRYKGGEIKEAVLEPECYQAICVYLRMDGRPPEEMEEGDFIFIPMHPERIRRLDPDQEVDPNQPISNSMANRILKKYARRAGVSEDKAHIHALRHAGARRRAEYQKKTRGRVDYGEIQDVLGHGSLDMTMLYSKRVLEDPEDPDGAAMAREWLPKGAQRRRKEPPGEQMELL